MCEALIMFPFFRTLFCGVTPPLGLPFNCSFYEYMSLIIRTSFEYHEFGQAMKGHKGSGLMVFDLFLIQGVLGSNAF